MLNRSLPPGLGGVPASVSAENGSRAEAIAAEITDRIRAGEYAPAGRLPAERTLAEQLKVSRTTMRNALHLLELQGLVASSPQSGWYIASAPLMPPPRQLVSFTEMARRRGVVPRTKVISKFTRAATFEERELLNPKRADQVLEMMRIRFLQDVPVCLDRSVIALWKAPGLEEVDFDSASLYQELTLRGTTPTRSDFTVEAAVAGSEAARLELVPSDPVLIGEERCFDQFGAPILLGRATYRANAYRFQASLSTRLS